MLERLLEEIGRNGLLRAGNRVAVAVSGGADSVALLRLLLEARERLGLVLSLAHLNHKIRREAEEDERFVAGLAERHGLAFHHATADVPALAQESRQSMETAAREARYAFFAELLARGQADKVATAHTLDDQAETVLMRLLRGAAMRGLAGIYARKPLATGEVVRPLLWARREELRSYLAGLGQTWREDASNLDLHHLRNRVRHELLPLLQRDYNPRVAYALAELAEVARAEEEYWEHGRGLVTALRVEEVASVDVPGGRDVVAEIELGLFRQQKLAVRRRVLRKVFDVLQVAPDFQQIERLLRMGEGANAARLELSQGWVAERKGELLRFARQRLRPEPRDYAYRLPVPGEVDIAESGVRLRARRVTRDQGYNPGQLLDAEKIGGELLVRNWRAGDRFFPQHSGSPKKLKEIFQQGHVPAAERGAWPVALAGEEVVWVRGVGVHAGYAARGEGVLIEELELEAAAANEGAGEG